jgi:WD40 repeat protein
MRRDGVIPDPEPGANDTGLDRERVGRAGSRRSGIGRVVALLAAAIGMRWLPAFDNPPEGLPMYRSRGHSGTLIQGFAFSPDGETIATVDGLDRVTLTALDGGRSIQRCLDVRGSVAAFAPDGRHLAVAGMGPDVILYDARRGTPAHPLGIPVREASSLRFSPDGRTLAVSSYRSGEIILWDIEAGRRSAILGSLSSTVTIIAFAPDGRSLAAGGRGDRTLVLWDLGTGRPRWGQAVPVPISLAFSPDGRLLATADGRERSVRIWDVRAGGLLRRLGAQASPIRSVAFSPDGRLLASGAGDGTAAIWSVATGRELRRLDARTELLRKVAFSPDGHTLAACGSDGDLRLWDLRSLNVPFSLSRADARSGREAGRAEPARASGGSGTGRAGGARAGPI